MDNLRKRWHERKETIGRLLILGWFVFSVVFAYLGNGDLFQRMGAAGVACAVFYFASVQHAPSYPSFVHEKIVLLEERALHHSKGLVDTHFNVGDLAIELRRRDTIQGDRTPEAIQLIAKSRDESLKVPLDPQLWLEFSREAKKHNIQLENTTENVEQVKSQFGRREVMLLIFATLQWGFGDLIVCYFIECGACSC